MSIFISTFGAIVTLFFCKTLDHSDDGDDDDDDDDLIIDDGGGGDRGCVAVFVLLSASTSSRISCVHNYHDLLTNKFVHHMNEDHAIYEFVHHLSIIDQ